MERESKDGQQAWQQGHGKSFPGIESIVILPPKNADRPCFEARAASIASNSMY
jgi:hypothetical protein